MRRAVMGLAVALVAFGCSSEGTDTSADGAAGAIEDGYVALCNDGNYSDNHDLTATCSGGDGIDRWLAEWGECEDGDIVPLGEDACGSGNDLERLLPDYELPSRAAAIEDGYVALCNDGNYSDNHDLTATCSGGDGIDEWLAEWGECEDGDIVRLAEDACGSANDLERLMPADYEPPPPTTAPPTTEPEAAAPQDQQVLTVENDPGLATLLAERDNCSERMGNFALQHGGRTIEFDGNIASMANHDAYDTRYDMLIMAGDYREGSGFGPTFQFENVSTADLHLAGPAIPDYLSAGTNLHIVARVGAYNADNCLFFLEPVSTTVR